MDSHFKIVRIFSDNNGDTHFEDLMVPLVSNGAIGFLSEGQKVEKIIFRKVVKNYDYDFHTAPARQYIILLDGKIEIETSLGDKRTFSAGEVLFLEDIRGKGHRTKNLSPEERSSIFITV